jgi:TM2 domain-containing membrane protein YozV
LEGVTSRKRLKQTLAIANRIDARGEFRQERSMKRFLAGLPLFFILPNLFAQSASPAASPMDPETAAAAAAAATGLAGMGFACCFLYCLFIAGCIVAWICVAIWIMRDAKSRQSENAQLVTILGWLVPLVGLIVHLATRPKVNLVPCPHCKKKRIEGSAVCPHCGQP